MDTLVFFQTDCSSITSQIKHQEEALRLKRRWLLSSTSESNHDSIGSTDFLNSECLPESLLREDDIFYETVKLNVEKAFGRLENEAVPDNIGQNEPTIITDEVIRQLDMNLDGLTNKGLYLIAEIITGSSVGFEKTRQKMKEAIRNIISKDFRKMNCDGKANILKQLHIVLNDPGNFRKAGMKNLSSAFQSDLDAAIKVLNKLESLSLQTLMAMKRKLEGSRSTPHLKSSEKSCPNRRHLINWVRRASEKMLSELSEEDQLQEPLAKAMSLVNLAYKIAPEDKSTATADFIEFSPETKHLQNEILKAIHLLCKKVRFPELKKVQLLLCPDASISKDSLRSAIRKFFIEFLFDCSDMDPIPDSFLKALAFINRKSRSVEHKVFPEEAIETEVECILNVSAQVKQILWEWCPNYELDQDFGDAYIEELDDSDDDDSGFCDNDELVSGYNNRHPKPEVKDPLDDAVGSFDPDHEESSAECSVSESNFYAHGSKERSVRSCTHRNIIRDLTESVTRSHPPYCYVTPMANESRFLNVRSNLEAGKSKIKIEPDEETGPRMGSENQFSSRSLFSIQSVKIDHDEKKPPRKRNQYLAIQEISDETSMVAYNLIGGLLERFAEETCLELDEKDISYLKGDSNLRENKGGEEKAKESNLLGIMKELMPSLDKSILTRLEELMN